MSRRVWRVRAGRPPKPKFHWHRELNLEGTLISGGNLTQTLLSITDYNANTALSPSGVTLVRTLVRGVIQPQAEVAASSYGFAWALIVVDTGQSAISLSSAVLTNERVLATGFCGGLQPTAAAGVAEYFTMPSFDIDCKQKVRLQDSELRLVFSMFNGTADVLISTVASVLLRGDTN